MKLKFYALFLLAFAFSAAPAQIYSFTTDTSGLYNSVATNATGIKLTRYNGATRPGSVCATGFSSTTFSTSATYVSTLPAVEANVTANAGYVLSVTDFSVGLRRSGTGPASVMLAYSTDGGATWIDKGTNDAPNNGSCGTTATVTWTTAITVPSSSSLQFRIFGFGASSVNGTMQILNLRINGTVMTTDSIFTGAASYGPFCEGLNDTIAVPFTTSGTFTGPFNVQLSDASGIFPNDATSSIISAGSTTSPVTAVIPSTTPWANGYRVRVVNANPTFYQSGDNGSNITLNQSVTPTLSITSNTTAVCAGQSVNFSVSAVTNAGTVTTYQWFVNGTSATTAATFSSTTLANNDSVYATLTSDLTCAVPAVLPSNKIGITIYPTYAIDLYDTLCPGTSLSYGGGSLSTAGNYPLTLTSVHGCDSIVTLHLAVKTLQRTALTASICPGTSYTFNGQTLTTGGTYIDTVRCDSIVTLTLSVKTVQRTPLTASICPGTSYAFNGQTLTTSGTYIDTVRCDSIVTLTLNVRTVQHTTISTTICPGSSFNLNGTSYSAAGTYSDTIRCDSIVTLTLALKTVKRTALTAITCPGTGYIFNGQTLTTAGVYSDTVRCDSIVTLTLSLKTVQHTSLTAAICQGASYSFHGASYSTAGSYSDTVRCDSIVTLTLTVHALPTVSWTPAVTSLGWCGTNTTLALSGASPAGGVFSGAHVTGDTLYNNHVAAIEEIVYTYTDANSCSNSDSASFELSICIGISETSLNSQITLYPNPTENMLHLDANDLTGTTTITITDMTGKVLSTETATGPSIHSDIDMSIFEKGIYLLTIRDAANHIGTKRVVKD